MFQVHNLTYLQGGKPLFQKLNLSVERGSVTALLGPSGSGKTTLLHLLVGRLPAQSGQVRFEGRLLEQQGPLGVESIHPKVGFLLQSGGLFTHLNLLENILFPMRAHTCLPERWMEEVGRLKLEVVGLKGLEASAPHDLSGGMAKRAALARALALDPPLLILDEPFAGQDPNTIEHLSQLILALNRGLRTTILVVSHDLPETLALADYVYVLNEGKIVKEGEGETFRALPPAELNAIYATSAPLSLNLEVARCPQLEKVQSGSLAKKPRGGL